VGGPRFGAPRPYTHNSLPDANYSAEHTDLTSV
jgi:hypothetical protein